MSVLKVNNIEPISGNNVNINNSLNVTGSISSILQINSKLINSDINILSGNNGFLAGPIYNNAIITIESNSDLTII